MRFQCPRFLCIPREVAQWQRKKEMCFWQGPHGAPSGPQAIVTDVPLAPAHSYLPGRRVLSCGRDAPQFPS